MFVEVIDNIVSAMLIQYVSKRLASPKATGPRLQPRLLITYSLQHQLERSAGVLEYSRSHLSPKNLFIFFSFALSDANFLRQTRHHFSSTTKTTASWQAVNMAEHDALILQYSHLDKFPRDQDALHALRKIASLVKPLMRARGWTVGTLAEFYPDQQNLLGRRIGPSSS